jgi:hypothetical protein
VPNDFDTVSGLEKWVDCGKTRVSIERVHSIPIPRPRFTGVAAGLMTPPIVPPGGQIFGSLQMMGRAPQR